MAGGASLSRAEPSGEAEVELLWTVAALTLLVYSPILRRDGDSHRTRKSEALSGLENILRRMTTYFPFGGGSATGYEHKVGGLTLVVMSSDHV